MTQGKRRLIIYQGARAARQKGTKNTFRITWARRKTREAIRESTWMQCAKWSTNEINQVLTSLMAIERLEMARCSDCGKLNLLIVTSPRPGTTRGRKMSAHHNYPVTSISQTRARTIHLKVNCIRSEIQSCEVRVSGKLQSRKSGLCNK